MPCPVRYKAAFHRDIVSGIAVTEAGTDHLAEVFGGSSNGRTPVSGSGYQGSNPCPPAKFFNICR